jgi:hypothetical protein
LLLKAAGYRAMPWKNGQGITREIDREPPVGPEAGPKAGPVAGDNFLWRLSIAEVAASGDFSLFPGYDRTITLIEGAGMRLDFDEAPSKLIDRRHEPFDFSGDWHCRCTLLAGRVRDFNLMVDRRRARARTEALRLAGPPVERQVADGWLLLYCAEGAFSSGGFAAEAGDTLRLGAGGYAIEGEGALVLAMTVHILRGR